VGTLINGNTIYEGWILNDKPHGKGKLTIKGESTFIGEFNGGSKIRGTIIYDSGDRIDNCIFDNDALKKGTCSFANGDKYDGHFKNSQFDDVEAIYYYSKNNKEREKYIGSFRNGKFNGRGTLYNRDSTIIDGWWENDSLIRGQLKNDRLVELTPEKIQDKRKDIEKSSNKEKLYRDLQYMVPYKNQLASKEPEVSCNVTSMAMAAAYLGVDLNPNSLMEEVESLNKIEDDKIQKEIDSLKEQRKDSNLTEDKKKAIDTKVKELQAKLDDKKRKSYDKESPNTRKELAENHGITYEYKEPHSDVKKTANNIAQSLGEGKSVVISVEGHLVQVIDILKDDKGNPSELVVNDPYGIIDIEERIIWNKTKNWEEKGEKEKRYIDKLLVTGVTKRGRFPIKYNVIDERVWDKIKDWEEGKKIYVDKLLVTDVTKGKTKRGGEFPIKYNVIDESTGTRETKEIETREIVGNGYGCFPNEANSEDCNKKGRKNIRGNPNSSVGKHNVWSLNKNTIKIKYYEVYSKS
jgi:hypothetical protein